MGSLDVEPLRKQLARCGRLPDPALATEAEHVLAWLGDYSGALRASKSAALSSALQAVVEALPEAERRSMAFFPRAAKKDPLKPAASGDLVQELGTYTAADGAKIGYMYMGAAAAPSAPSAEPALVVRWGGNAELSVLFRNSEFCSLVRGGLVRVFFVDYRGYGWSDGAASLATLRGDAEDFFLALPSLSLCHGLRWPPPGPLVVMGRSIGAHCALHVTALHPQSVGGLVLDSPASCHWPLETIPCSTWRALAEQLPRLCPAERTLDFCPCCPPGAAALKDRMAVWLDPVDLVGCIEVPLLLITGTADAWCPAPQTQALFDAAASPGKEIVWVEGASHNELSGRRQYWEALVRFLGGLGRVLGP